MSLAIPLRCAVCFEMFVGVHHCAHREYASYNPGDESMEIGELVRTVRRLASEGMSNLRIHLTRGTTLPAYARPGDSGLDLTNASDEPVYLWPGETKRVETGVAIELPPGHEAQIRPRSSTSMRGLIVHLGTIDNGYRGDCSVIVANFTGERIKIGPRERIAQLVVAPVATVVPVHVEALSETERGERGFGSTGGGGK